MSTQGEKQYTTAEIRAIELALHTNAGLKLSQHEALQLRNFGNGRVYLLARIGRDRPESRSKGSRRRGARPILRPVRYSCGSLRRR